MAKQTIELEPAASTMDPGVVSLLVALVNRAYARVPMTSIEFKLVPATSPARYTYELKAADDRTWTQSILFDSLSDPGMTFSVPDYWREVAEFAEFRSLRATLVKMVVDHSLVSFEASWS